MLREVVLALTLVAPPSVALHVQVGGGAGVPAVDRGAVWVPNTRRDRVARQPAGRWWRRRSEPGSERGCFLDSAVVAGGASGVARDAGEVDRIDRRRGPGGAAHHGGGAAGRPDVGGYVRFTSSARSRADQARAKGLHGPGVGRVGDRLRGERRLGALHASAGLVKLDPKTGRVLARVPIPLAPTLKHGIIDAWWVAAGAGSLWVAQANYDRVVRVTGKVARAIPVPVAAPFGVAFYRGAAGPARGSCDGQGRADRRLASRRRSRRSAGARRGSGDRLRQGACSTDECPIKGVRRTRRFSRITRRARGGDGRPAGAGRRGSRGGRATSSNAVFGKVEAGQARAALAAHEREWPSDHAVPPGLSRRSGKVSAIRSGDRVTLLAIALDSSRPSRARRGRPRPGPDRGQGKRGVPAPPGGLRAVEAEQRVPRAEARGPRDPAELADGDGGRGARSAQLDPECLESSRAGRDLLLPGMKQLRRTGRESRGRVERERARSDDPRGREQPVRRDRGRRVALLEAEARTARGARRGARAAQPLTGGSIDQGKSIQSSVRFQTYSQSTIDLGFS